MSSGYRFLRDLRPNITDKWQVHVMVSRAWTTYNPVTNRILSFDLILSDEQHCSIHAKIPDKLIDAFKNDMKEGCVYRIHKFLVLSYDTLYRPVRCDNFVQFFRNTRIYVSHIQPAAFKRYVFDLIPFNMLRSRVSDDKYLTDVIGLVREWGLLEKQVGIVQSCNPEMRKVIISDTSGKELRITLWGELAKKYTDEDIRTYKDNKIIVILTSCKVRLFRGVPSLMTTVASQLYLNLPVDIVAAYKEIEALPVSFQTDQPGKSDDFVLTSIADFYSTLQKGVIEGTLYTIDGTIVDVDMLNDWKFVQCSTCLKKVNLVDVRYFCSVCKKNVDNPRQSYRLVIRVINNQEEILCVLFNQVAISLLGLTVDELLMKSSLEGDQDPNWIRDFLIESLCARRVILTIKVDQFNLAPHYVRRFTVIKFHGDDINMPNKVINTTEIGTNTIFPKHGNDYCDVEEGEDEDWLNSITNDEWEMSAECIWGPCTATMTPTTSTIPVVGRNDEPDDSGKSKSKENDFEDEDVSEKVVGHNDESDDDSGKSNSEENDFEDEDVSEKKEDDD